MDPKYYGAAADYNKPSGFQFNSRILIIALGGLLIVVLLIVIVAVIAGINSAPGRDLATLVARESELQSLLDKNKTKINDGDLRKANADANLLLLSSSITLTDYMTSVYGLKTIPTDISAAEADTTATEDLKAAEQVGKFDSTITQIARTKLADTITQAKKVLGEVGNQELKAAIQNTITSLQSADDQLAKLQS